ncbi:hypothetical protein JNL27_13440 [bacterium]|nr:hypothetical protein [bacterium]
MSTARKVLSGLLMACACNFSSMVSAQSNWMLQRGTRTVSLEWLKPSLSNDEYYTFGTSVYNLTARLPMNDKHTFIVEVPFSHYGFEYDDGGFNFSETENTVGNIYVGMEIGEKDNPVFTEFGVRLPTVSGNKSGAQSIGILTDWDRLDGFVNDIIPVTFKVNNYVKYPSGFVTRVRVGPEFWFATNDEEVDKFELFILYSAHGGLEAEKFGIGIGFNGRFWPTLGENSKLSEQMTHQMDVNFFAKFKNVRPGLYLRAPVDDDISEVLNSVFGLRIDFDLNRIDSDVN